MARAEIQVASLFITRFQGAPMHSQRHVDAVAGMGLVGDRYYDGRGFWQTVPKPREVAREVSIASLEQLRAWGFRPEQSRRNIILEGGVIDFSEWVGQEFQVGGVRMRGVELCTPCKRPSQISGVEGFEKLPPAFGGLRAEVLLSGLIISGMDVTTPQELKR